MGLPPSLHTFVSVFLLTVFSYSPRPAVSRIAHNNLTDLESLLAFQDGVHDPHDFLAANWTADAPLCNSWFGVECSRRRQRVVMIDLRNLSLHGTVSPHLGNLSFLSYLNLGSNYLTGPIPSSLGRLRRLATLRLQSNSLSGRIPPIIFNMSSQSVLSLKSNNLSGPINGPFVLPRSQLISLSSNFLTGYIPSNFARCPRLRVLSLSFNEFTGRIPPQLGNITGLESLFLGVNKLEGTIPASVGNLTMLQSFSIDTNYVGGSIPREMGNLLNLRALQLSSNRLDGSIPDDFFNTSNLEYIELTSNELGGSIPPTLGRSWPHLTNLNMYDNRLTGGLDFIASLSSCTNLTDVQLLHNKLDGVLPDSVGNLSTGLYRLNLAYNYIKGEIPVGIGNLSGLVYLVLDENELTGEVPPTLSSLKSLQGLYISRNRISGKIPIELGAMASVIQLDLSHNTLSGLIPYSLGNITTLQYLNLASNKLLNIPRSLWKLSGLLELYLSENTIAGFLSPQIGSLKFLNVLDLSKNRLSGNISSALGELQMLTRLNLSGNSFSGQIPISINGLINIEFINLSHNSLSGTIPKTFANLRYLHSLDLSFNKLEGRIPQGGVFSNFSTLSLEGNAALCGAFRLGLPPCPSNTETSLSKNKGYLLKYIVPPIASVVVLVCCFYIGLVHRRTESSKLEADSNLERGTVNGLRKISYDELVRATDHFNVALLLGRGSSSSVFKAYLDDGSISAVKVMNVEDQDALRSFDVECAAFCNVRHRNLVKIRSTCSTLDFKALVLEFMPNGSLEQWLYSHDAYLNMLQRLNILVDVSLALEYLHHDHPQIIVHRDLKPSNVLLDEDMTAHVSDFGIAKLLLDDKKSILTTNAVGTFGYMAPEYVSTGNVSRKSDVYSFGILVLETLTGKRPSDDIFHTGLSLRQWASEAYPDAVLEIVDPNLVPVPLSNDHECLSSLIKLGLQCSSNSPKERMLIIDVVPIIQKIRIKYLQEAKSTATAKHDKIASLK